MINILLCVSASLRSILSLKSDCRANASSAARIGAAHKPIDQAGKGDSIVSGGFGEQALGSETRQRVDLQDPRLAVLIHNEIDAREIAAAECDMRHPRGFLQVLNHIFGQVQLEMMLGIIADILCLVVEEF